MTPEKLIVRTRINIICRIVGKLRFDDFDDRFWSPRLLRLLDAKNVQFIPQCQFCLPKIQEMRSVMTSSLHFASISWILEASSHTPLRTLWISGIKSRVLKLTFFSLKMIVKSGLEFILKLTEPLQRYLLSCQAHLAVLGRYFCTGQQQLWRAWSI